MAAYASHRHESSTRIHLEQPQRLGLATASHLARDSELARVGQEAVLSSALLVQLIDQLADRVALVLAERLGPDERDSDDWLDCRHAAEYLGLHRDTLRKLAAERAIPAEQDGPGCKLYFRRGDLDAWRRGGGRPRQLAVNLATAAEGDRR